MSEKDEILVPIDQAEFAVLDFETTGTAAGGSRVIEIGLVKVKKLKITDTYSSLINPQTDIPFFITQLTGIKTEDVSEAPLFEAVIDEIINFIGDSVIVAHNIGFDYSFLKSEFQFAGYELLPNDTLCTLKMARKLYPELKSKSLGNLVKHFRIRNKNAHRALGDATATARILIKMIEELRHEHNVESLEDLIRMQKSPGSSSNFRMIKKSLVDDFSKTPDKPGVYLFKDRLDDIIYVGKAKYLSKRVVNHFSSTAPGKSKKIVRKASKLEFIETNTELTALLLEAELVKINDPEFNAQLKKYSQNYFIRFDNTKVYSYPKVSSIIDFDGNDYFGPYNSADTAREMVEIVNRTFALRECNEKEFEKGKKCYLADIERCLAPCLFKDEESYARERENVYDFLRGKNQHAVDRLLLKMRALANDKKYEQAAEIRDTVNLILNQLHKTLILSDPVNKAHVMVEVKGSSQNDYLLLVEGKVFIRNHYTESKSLFNEALEDYYSGTIRLFKDPDKKDLERLKIALTWFTNHRNRLAVFYLKQFTDVDDLLKAAAMR